MRKLTKREHIEAWDLMELFLILGGILVVAYFVFGRKKKSKEKDKYIVVQERRTQVRNHVVKVPKKKR